MWYKYNNHRKTKFIEKDQDKFIPLNIQIKWIKNKINEVNNNNNIDYIFIIGHHCLWSKGPHGCPKIFGFNMKQLFKLSDKISGYFCGHNHALEHYIWKYDKNKEFNSALMQGSTIFFFFTFCDIRIPLKIVGL